MFEVLVNKCPITYEEFTFPGGEEHIKIKASPFPISPGEVKIIGLIKSSSDLIRLGLLVDALRRLPALIGTRSVYKLCIPYIPYARQDRVAVKGEPLSAAFFARYINWLDFDSVECDDPHSHVISALIERLVINPQHVIAYRRLISVLISEKAVLAAPDKGALVKTQELAELSGSDVIYFDKVRDPKTGNITSTVLHSDYDLTGRHIMLVDDICDGGRTFISAAEILKEKGASTISLFVTHGIFSKGLDVFDGFIDRIYSKNVWWNNVDASGMPTLLFKEEGRVK